MTSVKDHWCLMPTEGQIMQCPGYIKWYYYWITQGCHQTML